MRHLKNVRMLVFLPPLILLIMLVILNIISRSTLLSILSTISGLILTNFSWLISMTAVSCILLLLLAYCTKFGSVKIGGKDAVPIISKKNWMYITLTTTIGAGLLFFASSEPIVHLYAPPENVTGGAGSSEAMLWAISTLYLEWTWVPYAIYTVAALMFAYVFYNMKQPRAFSSTLVPVMGEKKTARLAPAVDALCLFTLVCGVSSAMGVGTMNIAGGLQSIFGIPSNNVSWLFIIIVIVAMFTITAVSGIRKGIQQLADLNMKVYWVIMAFILITGPTAWLLNFLSESTGFFARNFPFMCLMNGVTSGEAWAQSWPIFYILSWLSWTPVTAIFLGKISRGYTVRELIITNWVFPSIFATMWIALFGGMALYVEQTAGGLHEVLTSLGMEAVVYRIFDYLPFAKVLIPVYILAVLLSFVTATNSNTTAMADLSMKKMSEEELEPPSYMKIIWAVMVGVVAYILVTLAGIDGIKMAANIGGFPNLFFEIIICFGLFRIIRHQNN